MAVNEALLADRVSDIVRGALRPVVRQLTHLAGEYAAIAADTSLTDLQRTHRQANIAESLEALGILHCDVATRQLMNLFSAQAEQTTTPDRTPEKGRGHRG